MQVLSRALIELYDAAEHLAISEYSTAVMQVVAQLIGMDGGLLGGSSGRHLEFEQAYVYRRAAWLASDWKPALAQDPIARRLLHGVDAPIACDCERFYSTHALFRQDHFYRRHHIARMLLFGSPPGSRWNAPWIALFRSAGSPFNDDERQNLLSIWPHIVRGIASNRRHCLERQVADRDARAAALMNLEGTIEAEDLRFRAALLDEWPGLSDRSMPDAVMQCWRSGTAYIGARIRISMWAQQGYVLCHAKRLNAPDVLTRAERVVAYQFASGFSHRQIAENLGVSQNTVRTHIAHTYEKLNVHDKAALANMLAREAPEPW
jgi:DNA-binding CsgD family transcriptional regulator